MASEFPSTRPTTKTGILAIALKIALPAVMLWLVTRNSDWSSVLAIASRLSVGVIVLAIALITIQNFLAAFRWWIVMKGLVGDRLNFVLALRYLYVSVFVNQALPSSVGGDAVRIWLACNSGVSIGNAVRGVFLDRIFTMFGLVLLIIVALPVMEHAIPAAPGRSLFLATVPLVAVGFAALYAFAHVAPYFSRYERLKRLIVFLLGIRTLLLSWRNVLPPTLSAMAGFSMMTLIVYASACSLGIDLTLLECFVLCPPVFLLAALPISIAGWGVRESGMVVALGYAGVSPEASLVLALVLGMTVLAGSSPGLLFMLRLTPSGAAHGEGARELHQSKE